MGVGNQCSNIKFPVKAGSVDHMTDILYVSLRPLDRRIIQSQHRKTDGRCKTEDPLDDLTMDRLIPNDAFFPDFFPARFKLRLDQADKVCSLPQKSLDSGEDKPNRDEGNIHYGQIQHLRDLFRCHIA